MYRETSLREVVGLMRKHHIGGLPVMEGMNLSVCLQNPISSRFSKPNGSLMTSGCHPLRDYRDPYPGVYQLGEDQTCPSQHRRYAGKKGNDAPCSNGNGGDGYRGGCGPDAQGGIVRLPVMRGKKLVGILARADIINAVGRPILPMRE